MRVLVACEYSGTVRDAFTRGGHDAMSCDLLPSETAGEHYQGSVLDLMDEPFDLVIAHPPCTYLANSGVHWLDKSTQRWRDLFDGAEFFARMWDFNAPRIAVENPIQHKFAIKIHGKGKPDQYVQPYEFGTPETKRTGLWLVNLPPLIATDDVRGAMANLPRSQTERVWRMPPGPDRQKERARFPLGIAEAMASQWGAA